MINPFISIIMPAYNSEKYIQDSINSILFNEFHNLELIIIDDGSTDSTPEIIEDISDERVVILKQENKGPSSARNLGLKHAKGYYITFLDADDLFFKDSLKFRFEFFNNNPEFEALYSGHKLTCDEEMKETDSQIKFIENPKEIEYINKYPVYSLFASKFIQNLQALTIKKEALEKIGNFNESLDIAEDFDFYIKVLENCRTKVYPNRYSFKYRRNPQSLMHCDKNVEKQRKANDYIISKINNYNFPKKRHLIRKRKLCSNKQLDFIEKLILNGNKSEAKKLFLSFLFKCKFSKSFVLKRVIKIILRFSGLV